MRDGELLTLLLTTLLTLLVGIIISIVSHLLALVRDKRREHLSRGEREEHLLDDNPSYRENLRDENS